MSQPAFRIKDALAALRSVGLEADCRLNHQGRWLAVSAGTALPDAIGFSGATLDSRRVATGRLFIGLQGEHRDGRDFIGDALRGGAGCALTRPWPRAEADPVLSGNPGHDCAVLLCDDPVAALHALAAAHRRRCRAEVVGITGTNGKTTTKDLLSTILARHGRTSATLGNLNNELGVPLTLLEVGVDDQFAVIEMGASQATDIAGLTRLASPRTGVITNAGGAHLAGFGTLETVIRTKGELLESLPSDGTAVLNADSPGFETWSGMAPCRVLSWGRDRGDHRWSWSAAGDGGRLQLDGATYDLPLPGLHNGANLVAAILAARAAGIEDPDVQGAMAGFQSPAHRARFLTIGAIRFLDDTYNANPTSMIAAAGMLSEAVVDGRRIAVLGAMGELGDESERLHRETGISLAKTRLDLLITVGDQAKLIAEGFRSAGSEAIACDDHADATRQLAAIARDGDSVLVKGSRSAAMETILDLFEKSANPDLGRI